MQLHALPLRRRRARTFIVEMHDDVWRRPASPRPRTGPDEPTTSVERCAEHLRRRCSAGTGCIGNNSTLDRLPRRSATSAGATGTWCCSATPPTPPTSPSAPARSSPWRTRSPSPPACTSSRRWPRRSRRTRRSAGRSSLSTQRAAQASLEWFENLGQYIDQAPLQFAFNLLTRSRRVTHDNLRLRDPEFVAQRRTGGSRSGAGGSSAPADVPPVPAARLELRNRVVVSPMDMYSAVDGLPSDFHLVHLGGRRSAAPAW